jgi:RES domain-containing protein
MFTYRIGNCKFARDTEGTGAKLFGGRWNSVGVPMHYMASSRALAALEVLANKNSTVDIDTLCLTVFDVPEKKIKEVLIDNLPQDWKRYKPNELLLKIGDDFFNRNEHFLLKVPSSIIEDEFNYLMNVRHPLVKDLKVIETKPFYFDDRLV